MDNTLWTVGPGTFVDDMLKLANAVNVGSMQGSDGGRASSTTSSPPSS